MKHFLTLLVLTSLLQSCILPKVISDIKPDIDWSEYDSYRICPNYPEIKTEGTETPDTQTLIQIRKAIAENMSRQNLKRDDENPKVEIGFEIKTARKEDQVVNCRVQNESDYFPTCTFETYSWTEGELAIHMTDLSKNQIIWQGVIQGELTDPEKLSEKRIQKIVNKVFETFPAQ